jgi:hypothetical protein
MQCRHEHARCTKAALQRMVLRKASLQLMQALQRFKSFYGFDFTSIGLHSE